ncbi:MAG: hypothetical protein A2077_02085 [Nitrospirae bacterium GWC2_46_6]|nr:MAG: hypothetical protein A2077_02085 [Nitrospirae bacterium GWC2_46_6]
MKEYFREELLDKAGSSVYKLVMLVTKRAIEIAEGAPKLVDVPENIKPSTVAIMEIAENRVRLKEPKEKKE